MKYHYVLSRPWISSGNNGVIEDYAYHISDKEIKEKYNMFERVSGVIGLNNTVSEDKNKTYYEVMGTFRETISSFDDIDISFYEHEADSIDIEAKDMKRAYEKLSEFNEKLDYNLSEILHKHNYHVNLNGNFLGN